MGKFMEGEAFGRLEGVLWSVGITLVCLMAEAMNY